MTRIRGSRFRRATSILRSAWLLGVVAGLTACSNAHPTTPVRIVASCVIGIAQPAPDDTLSIATMASVDWAHVPVATNAAERLAFAQLYQTLIDVDCEGHPRPTLAASWTLDSTRTRITLSLRQNAMFWSGKPVTANDVLAAWRTTAAQSTSSARLAREVASGTTVVDDHTLIVSLLDSAWMVLGSPTLAVYERQATAQWPEGSGPYRIAEQSAARGFVLMPIASQSAPYFVSRVVPSGDPRDAIDAGSDVLVTNDPIAVSYASTRANLVTVPLPWSHAYVLAVQGAPAIVAKLTQPDFQSAKLRESLARDAVHVQARPAEPPYWWDSGVCRANLDSVPVQSSDHRSNRVVYRRDDRVARALAERLVALDAQTVAAGLEPNDFARALHDGGELAYVLDLPSVSVSSCNIGEIWSAAPWLANGDAAGAKLIPLIDTRETAILSRNRVSANVDWLGTLHFSNAESRP